jgi:hypothetical protein
MLLFVIGFCLLVNPERFLLFLIPNGFFLSAYQPVFIKRKRSLFAGTSTYLLFELLHIPPGFYVKIKVINEKKPDKEPAHILFH